MSAAEETVRLTECPRCGDTVLTVSVAGLTHLLAPWSVPKAHAVVLNRYGVTVLQFVRTGLSTYVTEFDSVGKSTEPIVTLHICGVDFREMRVK